VSLSLPAVGVVSNFFVAGEPLWWYSIDCVIFRFKMMHLVLVPSNSLYKNLLPSHSYRNDIVSSCLSVSVLVPQWEFGEPIVCTNFSIRDQQLLPALAHVKWQFRLPFEKCSDSPWSFYQWDFGEHH
jgi:hypothetical protein